MKLHPVLIAISLFVSAATLALAVAQHRELASLRAQEIALITQRAETPPAVPQAVPDNLQLLVTQRHTPSVELLRLRGEVGLLERRKRELADARPQNEQLRAQLATKSTNAPGGIVLPPGYIRKAGAKFVGSNTPEDTIQSLLWAIQNQDTARFLQMFNPELARRMEARIQDRGSSEEFFEEAKSLPGMRITKSERVADDVVELTVEILPGDVTNQPKLRLKQVAGQWKLMSGL